MFLRVDTIVSKVTPAGVTGVVIASDRGCWLTRKA